MDQELLMKNVNGYERVSADKFADITKFCESYKRFLDQSKTEREVVEYILHIVKDKGYTEFKCGKKYSPGDKIFYVNRGRAIIIATIGSDPIELGTTIVASHIDSPRIDLPPRPLFEESEMAFFKSQYYGGIKKYQWTTIPLSLHGVVAKKDGRVIKVCLGEREDEPVFCITDLLPHLATNQMKRSATEIVKGEELSILVGSMPLKNDKEGTKVKLQVMTLLNAKYGITEQDLISADLSFVPAFKARDIGFDASMIGSYGHDDRVCAYASLMAHLETATPKRTVVTVFADKEETGSDGNTGLKSSFMKYFIADLASPYGVEYRTVLTNSICLSADVTSAFDPGWVEPYDKLNSAFINRGVSLSKYTGARGKSGTSDASAEFMAQIINVFDNNDVVWQTGNLGEVDLGGGGTVAKYLANLNIEVVDMGVPVLSMHAPYEIVSKFDVYMTNRAIYHFINS